MFSITIQVWHVLLAVTIAGWAALLLWPLPPSRGDFDFSAYFSGLARLACGIIVTLFVWLVYFALRCLSCLAL